jgi:hypothetical protein
VTKTEKTLLARAAKNGRISTMRGFYTGARHGHFGTRESSAAHSLSDKGLLEFLRHHSDYHHLTGGWTTVHCTDTVWQITDAGRRVASEAGL